MKCDFENGYSISVISTGYGSAQGKLEALVYVTENQRTRLSKRILNALGMSANPQGWLTGPQALALSAKVCELPNWKGSK